MVEMAIGWKLETASIPEQGMDAVRSANEEERAELARTMEIVACDRFEVAYAARPLPRCRFAVSGRLQADVVQSCVVTLDPVRNHIDEEFSVEFWPPEQLPSASAKERAVLEIDDPEPIECRHLPLGRIFYEICLAALDPYPRQEGAELENIGSAEAKGAKDIEEGPFGALARWRPKSS
jgi:hypothetical protein